MRPRSLQWIRLAAGLIITIICLWLSLRQVHLGGLIEALKHVRWSWLTLGLIALFAGYAARVYRWWWMLRVWNPAVRLRSCVGPLMVGFAVNNVVPFRAGDALRVMGFLEQLGTPAARLLGSLLIERILDVTILLAFLLVGVVGLRGSGIPLIYVRIALLVAGAAAFAWALLMFFGDKLETFLLKTSRHRSIVVRGWGPRIEHQVRQLCFALAIVRTPTRTLRLIAMSIIVWSCEGGVFAAVANGTQYDGQSFGPWFALATGSISTMIPSSPGYVGTFDFFTISGLTAYGASASVAVATALVIHGVLWLPLTVAGLAYLQLVYLRGARAQFVAKPTPRQETM